jgi:hypothetical protein
MSKRVELCISVRKFAGQSWKPSLCDAYCDLRASQYVDLPDNITIHALTSLFRISAGDSAQCSLSNHDFRCCVFPVLLVSTGIYPTIPRPCISVREFTRQSLCFWPQIAKKIFSVHRNLVMHLSTEIYPTISETLITNDIFSFRHFFKSPIDKAFANKQRGA